MPKSSVRQVYDNAKVRSITMYYALGYEIHYSTIGLNVDLGSFFELAELLDRNELLDA